jgi:hypothetical protein
VGRNRCSEGLARTRPGWADPVVTYPRKADCLVSREPLGDWCTGGRDEGPASSAPITNITQGGRVGTKNASCTAQRTRLDRALVVGACNQQPN